MLSTFARECRESTRLFRQQAVARVISEMAQRLDDELPLKTLAEIAIISPFHFNRVFRQITGIPPCHFLSALRLDTARRLLLNTSMSVTDICFEVGYNSLGTFTTRFSSCFGISPVQLRRITHGDWISGMKTLAANSKDGDSNLASSGITGRISAPSNFSGLIFVGAFPSSIPAGRPSGCALLDSSGVYRIDELPVGGYYLFAAGFNWFEDPVLQLANIGTLRGKPAQGPVFVLNNQVSQNVDITLRLPELTDPPLLMIAPVLLAEYRGRASHLTRKADLV
jgi:AraC-like DNA-binding protein